MYKELLKRIVRNVHQHFVICHLTLSIIEKVACQQNDWILTKDHKIANSNGKQ